MTSKIGDLISHCSQIRDVSRDYRKCGLNRLQCILHSICKTKGLVSSKCGAKPRVVSDTHLFRSCNENTLGSCLSFPFLTLSHPAWGSKSFRDRYRVGQCLICLIYFLRTFWSNLRLKFLFQIFEGIHNRTVSNPGWSPSNISYSNVVYYYLLQSMNSKKPGFH